MKKLYFLFVVFISSIQLHAQTFLSIPTTGQLLVATSSGSGRYIFTNQVSWISNVASGTVILKNAITNETIAGGVDASFGSYRIAGSTPASINDLLTWLQTNVTGASSGGGGGSANPYPGSDYATSTIQNTQQTTLASINTKTKPLVARTVASVTVGTSFTTVTAANAAGYRVLIQNNGTTDIWISIGGTATLAPPSLIIKAGGGSYLTSAEYPDTQAITAISTVSQAVTVITY